MNQRAFEVNFDGLVGPTHNYSGLAIGNIASQSHRHDVSRPQAAALQGLAKMRLMWQLGVRQAVLPPQDRPSVGILRRLGFDGSDEQVLARAGREAPAALAAAASASCMWAANAATVSPSADTADGRVHFTAANLMSHLHRSIEADATAAVLRRIFAEPSKFTHHQPLPATPEFSDEGAANHTRVVERHGGRGIEVFVYGGQTKVYPARQSRTASQTIARLHQLEPANTCFVEQSPQAIDAGVFHNDVIAVGNESVLLYHAEAFAEPSQAMDGIRRRYADVCGGELAGIEISSAELSVEDAVATYLFNSQLVTLPNGAMAMICPTECGEHVRARAVLDGLVAADNPIEAVHFVDTRQSMRNGGGPACLRLRVVLTDAELAAAHQGVMFDQRLDEQLTVWVERHYRDELRPADLADVTLLEESRAALDELTGILGLGAMYSFQK